MVFPKGTLLQKQFSSVIKNENWKCTMEQTFYVGLQFFARANFLVIAIHKHNVIEIESHFLEHIEVVTHVWSQE